MTVNGSTTADYDIGMVGIGVGNMNNDNINDDYDSGHTSPTTSDFSVTNEEIQAIYEELDLDEEGITDEETIRRKTRIFVGGLKFESESIVLDEYFSRFGKIKEAVVIKDRKTGLSKGYGFVTMYEDMPALKAIAEKSPKLDGRKCNVNLAYIGQKKKPPSSKKPELRLKDLSPLTDQSLYRYSNGYSLSPTTILTSTGHLYQLGLPPLHGHQPVYHIPTNPSPSPMYDTTPVAPTESYCQNNSNSIGPNSPMSPIFQPPFYYTQPVLIPTNFPYSPNAIYHPHAQHCTIPDINTTGNEGVTPDTNNNSIIQISSNMMATTDIATATTKLQQPTTDNNHNHQQSSSPQSFSKISATLACLPTTKVATIMSNNNTMMQNNNIYDSQTHKLHDQVGIINSKHIQTQLTNSSSNINTSNNNNINNGLSILSGSLSGNHGNINLHGNNYMHHQQHPHMFATTSHPHHMVAATTFMTSPLPSPSLQGPLNQTQIFHLPPTALQTPHHQQHTQYATNHQEIIPH